MKTRKSIKSQKATFLLVTLFQFLGAPSAMAEKQTEYKEIDPNDVAGFEMIYAGGCKSDFTCSMGHTMLRVVSKTGKPQDDYIIAYTTVKEDGETPTGFIVNGLKGRNIKFHVSQMKDMWELYAVEAKREITRVPMQLAPDVQKNLVSLINKDHFRGGKTGHNLPSGYTLLRQNCAGKISDLLKEAGAPSEMVGVAQPSELEPYLFRNYIANYSHLKFRKDDGFERNFNRLPDDFYTFCKDSECARKLMTDLNLLLPNAKVSPPFQTDQDRLYVGPEEYRTVPVKWNQTKRKEVQRHFDLLMKARAASASTANRTARASGSQ